MAPSSSVDIKPTAFLSRVQWGVSRKRVEQMFPGVPRMAEDPTWNEMGFFVSSYGIPSVLFFYFTKGFLGSDRLVRVQIGYFVDQAVTAEMERPPDSEIETAYQSIRNDLAGCYGLPLRSPADRSAPPELRLSELLVWAVGSNILTLSCGLRRDGVMEENLGVGIGYGDRNLDAISQSVARGLPKE